MNKSGESGYPCLVPDLSGNAFSFSPLSRMFAVGLSYMAFVMLREIRFDINTLPCIEQIASGNLLYSTGSSARCSVMT